MEFLRLQGLLAGADLHSLSLQLDVTLHCDFFGYVTTRDFQKQ